MEIWKDIEGYEGLYQVSSEGMVKSLNYNRTGEERILKSGKDKDGYLYVILYKEGNTKTFSVHRLVAQAFLNNPDNLQQVNHIDENPTNNSVDNLEWCTAKYNVNYGTRTEKTQKPILQFSKTGEFIRKWESGTQVERELGIDNSSIAKCCKGKQKTAGNFRWCYAVINGFTIDISKLKKVV